MFRFMLAATFLILMSTSLVAKDNKTHIWVEPELNNQICWYQNQKYSFGALLVVKDFIMICDLKYKNQINGPLAWFKTDKNGNAIYPKQPSKITIN